MKFTKTQINEILEDLATDVGGYQRLIELGFQAMMLAERKEFLGKVETGEDKGNGFRNVHRLGNGRQMQLKVPRTRSGNFYPLLLKVISDQEEESRKVAFSLYSAGLTTEQVGNLFEQLYGKHYSKSSVSRLCDYAKEEVEGWLERSLDCLYPIVYIDATFVSTRRDNKVTKEAYYTVLGVKTDRTREVLAVVNFPTESAQGWLSVFQGIKSRGVEKIELLVSDGLSGLENALAQVYSGTPHQCCVVHLQRNVLKNVGSAKREDLGKDLREVFRTDIPEDTKALGWKRWITLCEKWSKSNSKFERMKDESAYLKYFTYLDYDFRIRSMIYTTNWIERLNRDYKRVLRMRGAMPNEDSVIVLMGNVAMTRQAYERKIPKLNYEQLKLSWDFIT
jgi:putative transposase